MGADRLGVAKSLELRMLSNILNMFLRGEKKSKVALQKKVKNNGYCHKKYT